MVSSIPSRKLMITIRTRISQESHCRSSTISMDHSLPPNRVPVVSILTRHEALWHGCSLAARKTECNRKSTQEQDEGDGAVIPAFPISPAPPDDLPPPAP